MKYVLVTPNMPRPEHHVLLLRLLLSLVICCLFSIRNALHLSAASADSQGPAEVRWAKKRGWWARLGSTAKIPATPAANASSRSNFSFDDADSAALSSKIDVRILSNGVLNDSRACQCAKNTEFQKKDTREKKRQRTTVHVLSESKNITQARIRMFLTIEISWLCSTGCGYGSK